MQAPKNDPYSIKIYGLANKRHAYSFVLDDAFFAGFEGSPITHALVDADVAVDKTETMLTCHFTLNGSVELECDRSLDMYDQHIEAEDQIIFKLGDEDKELADDVFVIERGTHYLPLSQHLYEFAVLALPLRRVKPELLAEEDEAANGPIYIAKADGEDEGQADIDPRWAALRRLSDN